MHLMYHAACSANFVSSVYMHDETVANVVAPAERCIHRVVIVHIGAHIAHNSLNCGLEVAGSCAASHDYSSTPIDEFVQAAGTDHTQIVLFSTHSEGG